MSLLKTETEILGGRLGSPKPVPSPPHPVPPSRSCFGTYLRDPQILGQQKASTPPSLLTFTTHSLSRWVTGEAGISVVSSDVWGGGRARLQPCHCDHLCVSLSLFIHDSGRAPVGSPARVDVHMYYCPVFVHECGCQCVPVSLCECRPQSPIPPPGSLISGLGFVPFPSCSFPQRQQRRRQEQQQEQQQEQPPPPPADPQPGLRSQSRILGSEPEWEQECSWPRRGAEPSPDPQATPCQHSQCQTSREERLKTPSPLPPGTGPSGALSGRDSHSRLWDGWGQGVGHLGPPCICPDPQHPLACPDNLPCPYPLLLPWEPRFSSPAQIPSLGELSKWSRKFGPSASLSRPAHWIRSLLRWESCN